MRQAITAESVAAECQEIARRHVALLGWKRGLHAFGRAIGAGARRARALYAKEARRIDAHEYLQIKAAERALAEQERARLVARLDQLDSELRGISDAASRKLGTRPGVDLAGAGG